MIRLGVAFVLAGVLGSGGDFVIRSYLNNTGDLSTVGLFNAGYMMTMTYVGMVFSAMETDYFPRLSGIQKLGTQLNETVNHQMEVSLLLVAPLLVFFIMGLPVLLPLLYSGKLYCFVTERFAYISCIRTYLRRDGYGVNHRVL